MSIDLEGREKRLCEIANRPGDEDQIKREYANQDKNAKREYINIKQDLTQEFLKLIKNE